MDSIAFLRACRALSVWKLTLVFSLAVPALAAPKNSCPDFLRVGKNSAPALVHKSTFTTAAITSGSLSTHVTQAILRVPELAFIRAEAERLGLRVWMFGGTASSFTHYTKLDLAHIKGTLKLQRERFDYDFTNIFRSTQDLDIVVDATPEAARKFQDALAAKYPHFLGSKANKWEVRCLNHRMGKPGQPGFKEALLNDTDFALQNSDSHSIGMVEITVPRQNEPLIRDLRHWNQADGIFLDDVLQGQISYLRSPEHFTTTRARLGENPEILSALRLLVKAFQYELEIAPATLVELREIIRAFDPKQISNEVARRKIGETAKKLVIHAVNIEYAMNQLDALGLRQKLIALGNPKQQGDFAWWLQREPLRSYPVGQGISAGKTTGKTAHELNLTIVSHETSDFLAYESITRAHSGEPNVLISRKNAAGETAAHGDGFYTKIGKEGARGTGFTIRYQVHPEAPKRRARSATKPCLKFGSQSGSKRSWHRVRRSAGPGGIRRLKVQ